MAWERRGSAGPFYYRAKRINGKVVKEYFGRGEKAEQAAREDAERRAAQEAARRTVREELNRTRPAITLTKDVGTEANLLLEAILLATGLHRRNYGPWRMRRAE